MTADPRAVEIVSREIGENRAAWDALTPEEQALFRQDATDALAALTAAGWSLLPPGGQTREVIAVLHPNDETAAEYATVEEAETYVASVNERGGSMRRATRTEYTGPWQPGGVRDHPESRCRRCGGPNIVWSAPSPLWNEVMRGGDINGKDAFGGIVCPICFAQLAEERGIADLWRFHAERVHVPLATTTPGGRVWNPETWMWQPSDTPGEPA